MKKILLSLAVLFSPLFTASAQFPPLPAADLVLGAADFDTPGENLPTATGLSNPLGIAIDPTSGAVFVADYNHSRVVRYPNMDSLTNGAAAVVVFGQADLTQSNPGLSATALSGPCAVHVDAAGRLWVADTDNNRILMYENASTLPSGSAADLVLGQPDFDTGTGGNSSSKMSQPFHAFVDSNDNLWVADRGNSRVLKFSTASALSNGAAAATVLGQVDFGFNAEDLSASGMRFPVSIAVDAAGSLWVSDEGHDRVLRFDNAAMLANGAPADGVLGQVDFVSSDLSGPNARFMGQPNSFFIDASGTLGVNDYDNCRVLLFKNARLKSNGAPADDVIGQPDFSTSSPGLSARKMQGPYGCTVDPSGRIWVCDAENDRVLRFTPDRTPPVLSVKKVPRSTSKAKLKIQGTAGDANGIAAVRYRIGKSADRPARGAASWNFNAKLKPGLNKIEIQATDAAGNLSVGKRVKVRRR